ncbi:calcium/calmodulin protein kinase [Blastocystis sp. subtype 4]|uniref:calcium/calmodulin protein kinase n=1 Tax=Blastocystis sp. subtype 4 TaxID=944170 RepID=UPI000711A43A|nr:calcium/calmodulin protein kinase [Blastocystis sp. subtype 4]KNB46852.1 calcium/calmodulin protein kinase [Blastocystis sp. subtype 4]|eukprot:XP_014530295.1 calcium/calmodulin protein kinase [Blastocystis sp. subtype 4]
MTNKLLKSGYFEKQGTFRKKWTRKFLELRENELIWYKDEGEASDSAIPLQDIASVEDTDYNVDKPHCLVITLTNRKVYWFSFETMLEMKSWKAAIEDAKTLFLQNQNGSDNSPIAQEIAEEVDPQLCFILKRMELCDNVKDLRAFLREIETIAMDLPSSKARIQYQYVADAINKVRASKLDLFSEAMDSYVNSVLELFNFVSAEEEDDANTGVKANASAVRADILSMYKFKTALGSGTYSVVKLATDKRTGEEVAIKVITKSQLSGDDTVSLNREVSIMSMLRQHPNVVNIKGYYQDNDYYYVVQELCSGGELFDAIVSKASYSEREAQTVVRTLLYTIAYCHDRGIVHRDLKPENILLKNKQDYTNIKIADFGFARETHAMNGLSTSCGTPGYLAPEIMKGQVYGPPVDIWAIGVITYILLCGYPPFSSDNDVTMYRQILRGKFDFPSPEWDHVSDAAKDFISKLLIVDPEKRYTAKQVFFCFSASMLPWMRYESQGTMHMDGAVRMLEHFNIRRRRNTSIMMDDFNTQPTNTIITPSKTNASFVAIKDAHFRKAPSLSIPEGATIPKGTEFEVEQVIYTADGTWLRVSLDTVKLILKNDSSSITTGWICAEPREADPFCIPSNSQLFVSLWNKDQALHNVRPSPSASDVSIAKIASGQMYIACEVVEKEGEEWIRLHPQTLHTHRLPDKPCWIAVYLKNEAHFLKRVESV